MAHGKNGRNSDPVKHRPSPSHLYVLNYDSLRIHYIDVWINAYTITCSISLWVLAPYFHRFRMGHEITLWCIYPWIQNGTRNYTRSIKIVNQLNEDDQWTLQKRMYMYICSSRCVHVDPEYAHRMWSNILTTLTDNSVRWKLIMLLIYIYLPVTDLLSVSHQH